MFMQKTSFLYLFLLLLTACGQQQDSPDRKTTIRIAAEADPQTIDPRLARTLIDTTFMRALYEGLLRTNENGEVEQALAAAIEMSSDGKLYTITLKPSEWSDGSSLTAEDFVETWKSILSPSFPSPIAPQLFAIKNAKKAKTGEAPLDDVGLKILSPQVFSIELEIPYATDILGTLPVHRKVRQAPPSSNPHDHVFNGPFKMNEWKHQNELTLSKNEHYWDKDSVRLSNIKLIVTDGNAALTLFYQGQLDWIGSPLATLPQDAVAPLKEQGKLQIADASGTYWFRFNTQKEPFNHLLIRKAFTLALNRSDIVEHMTQGNQKPAQGVLPIPLQLHSDGYYEDNQPILGKKYFQAAMEEMGISKDHFPTVTICYGSNSDRNSKIVQAVQQQWQAAFGIQISLQACEPKIAYDKLAKGDYQLMLGSWFADIDDPINFLNVFRFQDNGLNHTGWENDHFKQLLALSDQARSQTERKALMTEAEAILMQELPIAPLFYNAYNYLQNPCVQGVYFSPLGYLDFKRAYIEGENG
jgi:oligopeptide transport system substrate-binding protein